ncbi:DUF4157 domain-containing protein [Nordella sp. HKS 07]|uniref:eCIS core domain-containing protein n=1 Tax=Nordella sp. HKS 07 TaxID=2712222 RepID=UPI0013E1523F|nr:DUF4157 domain-containing protein [Nordella sp. HKS 07]QIG50415.1 DUF4157 domain-containing protein [Nordella sp. HKS 07]
MFAPLMMKPESPTAAMRNSRVSRPAPVQAPVQSSEQEPQLPRLTPSLPGSLQRKLAVGTLDDPLEQEADHAAEQVTSMPASKLTVTPAPPVLSRKCAECEEEEKRLQRKVAERAEAGVTDAPAIVRDVLRSPGRPLSDAWRSYFEPRFGRDFSQVRLHTEAHAGDSARAVGARAYTVGRHIVFADVQSGGDRALLAHELAHVVQQSAPASETTVRRAPVRGPPNPPPRESLEIIAQRLARLALGQHQINQNFPGGPVLSVVRDDVSGRIFVAFNTGISRPLTELMNQRLLAHIQRAGTGQFKIVHDIVPGGHAEVIALNDAITAREAATQRLVAAQDLPTFELHNVWLQESRRFETAVRCEHCGPLTEGVRVTRSLYIAENPVSVTSPAAVTVSGTITPKEPGSGERSPPTSPPPGPETSRGGVQSSATASQKATTGAEKPSAKAPPPLPEISRGAFQSSAASGQEATTGAVGGAAMMIHQGQVQNLENYEHQKAEEAVKKIEPIVRELTSQGSWVAVKIYFDAPKTTNLLASVFKESSDVSHFLWVTYSSGDTREQALGQEPAKMGRAPLGTYEAPKNPLGEDRTGYVADVRIFRPDPNPQPMMFGYPSFVGTYSPFHVEQNSVGGRFDQMVATGMHRSLRFHAGSAADPRSVVEMSHVDFDGTKHWYETEWVSGNDPSKGINARFVEKSDGKILSTINSYFKHVESPSGNVLGENVSGESTSAPGVYNWSALIVWKQNDNSR